MNYFSGRYIEHNICKKKCLIHLLWLLSFRHLFVLWAHGMMKSSRTEFENKGNNRFCVLAHWLYPSPLKVVFHKLTLFLTTGQADLLLSGTPLLKMCLSFCNIIIIKKLVKSSYMEA